MARGPFATETETVRPIQDVQLSEGAAIRDTTNEDEARIRAADNARSRANLSLLGAGTSLLGQTAQLAENVMETRAVAQITEELQSVRDSLKGDPELPSVESSVFGKEAMDNPDFRNTIDDMKRIKAAERTGKLTRDFVIERFNDLVATAKSRNPAFSDSIEKAARDVLGFSPQNEFAKTLLRITPEEQARQQLEQKAVRLGITPEDVQTMELSAEQLALQKSRFELLKLKGNYDGNVLAQETRSATALAYTVIADNIGEQVAAGGVQDPTQLKAFIQQQFGAQRARLLANMPSHVDPSFVNSNITTLANEESRLLSMVDNGSIFKFMEQNKDLIVATAEQDILQMPVLGKVYAAFGPDAGAEMMSTIARFKDNPEALKAVFATGGPGAGELNLGLMLEGINGGMDVLTGQRPPANDSEARVASWLATKKLQAGVTVTPDGKQTVVDGQEAVRLVDVLKGAGQDVSVSAFTDPRVVKTITATKETHPQLINLVDSYQGILANEYANLLARNEVPTGDLTVENGVIIGLGARTVDLARGAPPQQIGAATVGRTGEVTQQGLTPRAGFQRWVAKANRLIKMGELYRATGVLPPSVYSDPDALLKTLMTGVQQSGEPVPPPKTVVKWGLDEKGNPVPIDD